MLVFISSESVSPARRKEDSTAADDSTSGTQAPPSDHCSPTQQSPDTSSTNHSPALEPHPGCHGNSVAVHHHSNNNATCTLQEESQSKYDLFAMSVSLIYYDFILVFNFSFNKWIQMIFLKTQIEDKGYNLK